MAKRNPAPSANNNVEIAKRREQVVALRLAGWSSWSKIGQAVGISKQAAWKHYQKALADINSRTREGAEELRMLAHLRFESMIQRLWTVAMPSPERVEDPDHPGTFKTIVRPPDLAAIDRIARILVADADVMGYRAPQKHEITMDMVNQALDTILNIVDGYIPDSAIPEISAKIESVLDQSGGLRGATTFRVLPPSDVDDEEEPLDEEDENAD